MRFLIPVLLLAALLVLLAVGLQKDPREVPSPLVGKPAPAFDLPALTEDRRYTREDLLGRPLLVNFFASWCAGCQVEHPVLLKLAREQGVEIIGMDYKDTRADAERWLSRHGNPYRIIIADEKGQAGLDWGVYGVPETYVIARDGRILYKQIGPLTEAIWLEKIQPLMAAEPAV